jgi:hypothetical protein
MKQPETGAESVLTMAAETALVSSEYSETHEELVSEGPHLFPVSEDKLMTLYILSFGLYGVFWFYKNWKYQEHLMDKKIHPVWRGIFSIFFAHSLFKRIDQQASHLEQRHKFKPFPLATFYVATVVGSQVLDRFAMNNDRLDGMSNSLVVTSIALFLLSTYPLLRVQSTTNRINNDMLGYLNYKYSVANYVLMAIGSALWLLSALALLLDSTGFVTT